MNFYKRYVALCNSVGKSPSRVGEEIGVARSTVNKWKNGGNPSDPTAFRIAEYFGITVDHLFGREKEKNPSSEDDELTDLLDELRSRPDMRMLFSITRGATKEDVMKAVKIIEALRSEEQER